MPDLLLEIRSEEIPARLQRKAAGDLRKLVTDGLVDGGLTYEGCQEYWTPRRLTLDIRGVTARSRDVREEIKGPSTKAPEQAIQGFLRKARLTDVGQAHVHADPKKGDFYVAHVVRPGRSAEEIIAAVVPAVIRDFPWPKPMRWGKASAEPGSLRWVRPLQSIVCTFGPETAEPVVVDFEVGGIRSGNVTYGHRFHAPGPIEVRRFEDYAAKLEAARVVIDAERRKRIILADAQNLSFAAGLELVEDEGLLEEVSGLVEWPVVLMGEFEEAFLQIPSEVIRLTIRANQKCFVVRPSTPTPPAAPGEDGNAAMPHPEARSGREAGGTLSNRFILTANIDAKDGGREIAYGNGKVVRARLSDALYFWKTDQGDLPDLGGLRHSAEKFGLDLAKPLDQRMARLDHLDVTFHARLGTQGERVQRIMRLAGELAPVVGAEPVLSRRAATLAKADLQTEVVGEFPELQGAMGRKYALLQGEHPSVAAAIEEHYKPQGPSDRVPADPVSVAVALADKLDTLVGFWAIDEKPTGSKDPYALRRAALGVIRIVLENGVRLGLRDVFMRDWIYVLLNERSEDGTALAQYVESLGPLRLPADQLLARMQNFVRDLPRRRRVVHSDEAIPDLLSFFHDRLKVYLRDQGARHDLIDAVLASASSDHLRPAGEKAAGRDEGASSGGGDGRDAPGEGVMQQPAQPYDIDRGHSSTSAPTPQAELSDKATAGAANDDLLMIVRRVEALGTFLDTEDGTNLLAGTRRAANIVAAEEKKGTAIGARVQPALFATEDEETLYAAVNRAEKEAGEAIEAEDFSGAMRALSALREPVDSFFERVLVNDEDPSVRANRLALLSRIRAATAQVADFSRIAG